MNWKKAIGWFVLGWLTLVAVLFLAAAIVLRLPAFHRFVIAEVERRVQRSTGARLEIGAFAVHLSSLSVDVYGVVLHGSEPSSQLPLFTAAHAGAGAKFGALLHRKLELSSILLDRPELHLRIDAEGRSNLPESPTAPAKAAPASASSSVGELFDLAVGQIGIHSGDIYFNDRKIQLSAELHDFRAGVAFNSLTRQYKVDLAYDRGRLEFAAYKPLQHDAQLQLTVGRTGAALDSLTLSSGRSHIAAQAKLTNYEHPSIDGSYQATISTAELGRILNSPSIPAGDVSLRGTLRYHRTGKGSFIDAVYTDGKMDSSELAIREGQVSARASAVHADYRLDGGNLSVQNLSAALLGGSLGGSFQMLHVDANPASRVAISLQGVQLETLSQTFLPRARQPLITGKLNVSAQLAWAASITDGTTHAIVSISAPSQRAPGDSRLPVNALIDLDYDGARATASFHQSYLRTPNTDLSISGILSDHSNLAVQAGVRDLSELDSLLSAMPASSQSATANASLNRLGLGGSAQFMGAVRGSTRNPELTGQFAADNFQVAGSRWRSLRTGVDASSRRIALQNAVLLNAGKGQIAASASVALSDWSFTPDSAIAAQATVANMSVSDLEELANRHDPVTGQIAANLSFHGSERHPAGNGSLSLTQATAWSEPIRSVTVQVQGDGTSIRTTEQIRAGAGALSASLNYSPATQDYDVSLNTSGIDLAQVHAVQARGGGVGGKFSGSANGHGTLDDPQLDGAFQIAALQVQGRTVPQVMLHVNVARKHAMLALDAGLDPGTLQVMGDVALTGEYPFTATTEIQQFPLGLLAAAYLPAGGPSLLGRIDVHATLSGPLRDPPRIQAHVEIPTFSVGYKTEQIANTKPLVFDYRNRTVTIQPTELKGSGTDVTLQGSVPLAGASPLNVAVKGTLDLAALKSLSPDLDSSGQIQLDLSTTGSLAKPAMQGQLRIVNASLSTPAVPIGFSGMNGQFTLRDNRLQIDRFTAAAGGGSITASGSMTYGTPAAFDVHIDAKTVRVRYPEGVRSVIDAQMQLNGTSASSVLSGRVLIDDLSFSNEFDMGTLAASLSSGSVSTGGSPLENNMKLDLAIASTQNLNAQSTQLSIAGAANLNLSGTVANPVLLGRMTLTGGDIFFRGRRYEVQSGSIAFGNPVRTEPIVNLFITTTIQQYDITMNFVGPLDRLQTNYTSTPALPPADIINLIAFGQTAEALQAAGAPVTMGAESTLASQVAGQVTGPLQKLGGFSQLTVDPLAGTNSADPAQQLAIQKRVTGNLLLTFSTNVTTSQNQAVQLQYQATRNVSVSVLRDQNGGYALVIRVRRTF